jgi:hypothetical protein
MACERLLVPVVRKLEKFRAGRSLLRFSRRLRYRRDPLKPRVLCVGFQKTGTSSVGVALRQLGFSHFGYDQDLEAARGLGDLERCLAWAEHFDSLDDLPWFSPDFVASYRLRFPGSRYVLLERDEQEWVQSYLRFFGAICSPQQALHRYRNHNTAMLNLLGNEPYLLRMNVCAGQGYEILCPFLGVPVLEEPFPWIRPQI